MPVQNILSWTHNVLKITPDRWMDLTSDLPAELLTRSPAPGEWSALQCLQHLVETERLIFPVMQPFIAGCGPWQNYFADHTISER